MADKEQKNENISDSSSETSRPSHSSSNTRVDPKKMKEEIRKAKEDAIPKITVNAPGGTYAPGKKPPSKQNLPPRLPLTKKQTIELGGILGVLGIIITVLLSPVGMNLLFPTEPKINVTDLNAQDGIIDDNNLVYSYKPRSFTPNETKNETFYLKISNTGNADAHNFWINIDSIPDGLWFDFQTSFIIHEGKPTPCQQKSSYCTISLVPKESSNMMVEYNVEFDHKLYQEIKNESPKLVFNYGYDEGQEETIELQLKFD